MADVGSVLSLRLLLPRDSGDHETTMSHRRQVSQADAYKHLPDPLGRL
jgi:hypothetical protein